jgi:hypothetical protein
MSIVYQVWEAIEEDDGIFPSETSNFGGGGKYMAVAPEDLEFTFEYDANNYARGADMPTMVEIFVTAHIKEPG